MTRKGSDVRGATIAKAAPQVIVGCGYLTDVIISPCRKQPYCKRFGNGSNPLVGLKMPTSENGGATVQGAGCGVELRLKARQGRV